MIGPRSPNVNPEPASRSITVRDACTSCSGAAAAIVAAASLTGSSGCVRVECADVDAGAGVDA